MFLVNKTPNILLTKITHYLHKKKSDKYAKKINELINITKTSELIPSFVFLSRWITKDPNSQENEEEYDKKKQMAIIWIGQITQKIPTVILLTGFFEASMNSSKLQWYMRDFYLPFYKRINKLRSYMKPFSLYSQIPSSFQTFPDESPIVLTPSDNHTAYYESRNYQNFYIDIESNPSYRTAIQIYFKRMILNRAPIDSFKPLVCQRSSRSILTKAIIELLQELNKTRDATQEELIFSFSTVFLYIHAFALSNEIDSQSLCEYLKTRSFISPFCALAMVNLIPSNLYLFNLLSPRELSTSFHGQKSPQKSQYVMVDLSKSSNLNGFTSKMPMIMSNYFLSNNVSSTSADTCNKLDDNEFLSFVHLSSANLYNKMKVVLSVTRERALGPVQVSSMGILLLRCIIFSVQKTYLDCIETQMFTETFCNFIRTIFSILTITFSESLGFKFFDISAFQKDNRIIDLILRPMIKKMMVVCLNTQVNEHLVKLCFMAAKYENSRKTAHVCIRRLTECGRVIVLPSIVNELEFTNDVFFMLEYIDALPKMTHVKTFGEYKSLLGLREKIARRLGVTVTMRDRLTVSIDHVDSSVMFSNSVNNSNSFNSVNSTNTTTTTTTANSRKRYSINADEMDDVMYNRIILTSLEKLNGHNCIKEMNKLVKNDHDDLPFILYVFSMSHLFQNDDFAAIITSKLKQFLSRDKYSEEEGPTKFELRQVDYAFPVSLGVVGRLLVYDHYQTALDLMISLEKVLIEDQSPLHYIVHFLRRYRPLLMEDMIQIFDRIVISTPVSDQLYVRFVSYSEEEKVSCIKKIATNLIDNDMVLIQDPEVINREYHSLFTHALVMSNLSLSLSKLSDEEIAHLLFLPVEDLSHSWMMRKNCCLALSKLASSMNNEVALAYFRLVLEKKNSQIAILCGRLFLLECRIDVYREICLNCRSLLLKKSDRLELFLSMIMPSFVRMNGGEDEAVSLIEGFFECIGNDDACVNLQKELVEEVMDAVGLFAMKLEFDGFEKKIFEAVEKFSPKMLNDVKTIIETSKYAESYWNG